MIYKFSEEDNLYIISFMLSKKSLWSCLKLGYFLERRFASFAKSSVTETVILQFIKQTFS